MRNLRIGGLLVWRFDERLTADTTTDPSFFMP